MKITMKPTIHPRRGAEVLVGNVYSNPHGKSYFKVVLGIVQRQGTRPWNNVVMLHVDATGRIVGSSNQPIVYVSEHQDLVGRVRDMPELKISWLRATADKNQK